MKLNSTQIFCLTGLSLFALASLGQFQRIQLAPNLAFYFQDIGIFLWLLLNWWLGSKKIWKLVELQNFFRQRPEIFWTLIWILMGWLLALIQANNFQILLRPILYLARLILVVIFSFKLNQKITSAWPNQASKIFPLTALVFGLTILLWGLMQYFWLPDTRFLKTFGWDDHYYRLISTLFDPGFSGLILGITLLGWVGWAREKIFNQTNSMGWLKIGWLNVSFGLITGILLTYSRASYLAIVIGLGWLGLNLWKKVKISLRLTSLILMLTLGLGILILPQPTGEGANLLRVSTVNSRLTTSRFALERLSPVEWWLGNGLFINSRVSSSNQFPDHAQLPDNIFITFLTGIGLGGLLVMLKLWGQKAWLYWQSLTNVSQSIWLAVLTHSLFNNSLFQPQIWLLLQLWLT